MLHPSVCDAETHPRPESKVRSYFSAQTDPQYVTDRFRGVPVMACTVTFTRPRYLPK